MSPSSHLLFPYYWDFCKRSINLDFSITLTQKPQKDLGQHLEQLSVAIEKTTSWWLTAKAQESKTEDE